ncbi:acyloxyacyl hydrolase [Shewanella khirikhana]|uniref:acyloxyacyl hydrolase n=1 Tax=Shewanella khirikhana TaxID=1965282 RepID=UPI0030CDCF74
MQKSILFGICLMCSLTFASPSHALTDNSVAFSSGVPSTEQNKDIESLDLSLERQVWVLGDDFAHVGFSVRMGKLTLDEESTLRTGVGTFIAKDVGIFTFSVPMGLIWLDQTQFGANELHTKDYGGPLQFFYGAEMAVKMSRHWQLFYRYEHMSNGGRYEFNPTLNSHNLGFRIQF